MPLHSRRHDVYDDTRYGPQGAIDYPHDDYEHRRAARRHHRRRNDPYYDYPGPQHHPVAPLPLTPFHPMDPWALGPTMDPFYPMDPYINRGEQQMDRGITPFPTPNLFRGMMTSFDRLWDEMTTNSIPHPSTFQNHPGSHYYYESKTRTVGPDGRVHEETVRTVPGADGQPETRRTVREGEHNAHMRSVFDAQIPHPALSHHNPYSSDNDVIVEELDEDGNVIRDDSPTRRRSRSSRDEEHYHRAYQNEHSDNWLRNQYRRWRSRD